MMEYGIIQSIWLNSEPFPWDEINRAIKLCTKWVFRKLTFADAIELHYLLQELLDTDLCYILYGFTHKSIKDKDARDEADNGIFEVGIKNEVKRSGSQREYDLAMKRIGDKYYAK